MAIDRSSPMPLWAQLLAELRVELRGLPPGSDTWTELELVERYGVSRSTVREALRRLRDEGLLVSRRGRGTTVAQPHVQPQGALWSLFSAVESAGHSQESVVLSLRRVRAAAVARRLALPAGEWLVHLSRIRNLAGRPLAWDQAWLPASAAAPLLDADFRHTSLYAELAERCGLAADAGEETVGAIVLDETVAGMLGVRAGSAGLVLERRSCAQGRFLEWRRTVVRADHFSLSTQWSPAAAHHLTLTGDVGGRDGVWSSRRAAT